MLGVRDIGGDEHRQGTQVHGAIVGMVNTGITSTMKPPGPKERDKKDTAEEATTTNEAAANIAKGPKPANGGKAE